MGATTKRGILFYVGDLFDIHEFHSVILGNCAVPVNVLEELFLEWQHEVIDVNTEKCFSTVEKEFLDWRQEQEPEMSTYSGNYKYNDKLELYNYNVYRDRVKQAYKFHDELFNMDKLRLSAKQQISFDVLSNILRTYTDGYDWRNYGNINPFNFIEGFQKDPGSYLVCTPFDTQGDYLNYARRIEQWPQQYDEMLELTKKAIDLGITDENVSVNRMTKQFDDIIVENPTDFVIYKPFNDSATKLFGENTSDIKERLKSAITKFIEKLKEVKEWITNDYMPHTRDGLVVSHLPNGSNYYKACLEWHTSLDISPEEVHQKGFTEVDRITKEMKQAMARFKFSDSTTIKEAYAAMANGSKLFINDGEKTLERFRQIIFKRIQPKLKNNFTSVHDLPLQVKSSPTDGIGGEYMFGSDDGTTPGIFFANVRGPEDNPTYTMISLALHETIPGHHTAKSYVMTSDLPEFRKHYTWRSYSSPFYFPFFNSYVEGWALYA